MEKSKFTAIQQQVIKSIEKSIEKDLKELDSINEKSLKKISKLERDIEDTKGILKANQELIAMNIDKALAALGSYTGASEWVVMGKKYVLKEDSPVSEIKDFKSEEKDCSTCTDPVDTTPKVGESLFQKEEEEEEQKMRDKEVSELPWSSSIGDEDEELPFKEIFSSKK